MVYIFDSHPVQYKAPVYQRLQQLAPGRFHVIYATDCSVRGHVDREFGQFVAWNTPLLEGYPFTVLHNERGIPLQGFRSLTGRGIHALLHTARPQAIILSEFIYAYDFVAYASALRLGIPVWLRQETQDEAFHRSPAKELFRSLVYRLLYLPVTGALCFGELNRQHLTRFGIQRVVLAPFCTPDPPPLDAVEKQRRRDAVRDRLHIPRDATIAIFSGKFIAKKNPGLLLEAFRLLPEAQRKQTHLLFVGSGELEPELRRLAEPLAGQVHFTGLVNQAEIFDYYLAADILVLPSRRAGETWGLVVNEALQAGCGVILTDAVGCHAEFGQWDRVRVIPIDDTSAGTRALAELASLPHDFDWCAGPISRYSVMATAQAFAGVIDSYSPPARP